MTTFTSLIDSLKQSRQLLIGLLVTGVITLVALWLSKVPFIASLGFGTLTLAIIIGIILGNTLYPTISQPCQAGVHFAKQRLLRLGIILYGFNLTFQQVFSVGLSAIIIDTLIIATTFTLAYTLGRKVFGLDKETTVLIGAGASICGAAAVMATEPLLKTTSSKVAVAIATVVIFGTLAMFVYPWLYQLNASVGIIDFSQSRFGIYIGSTVHEVAQVVAAGNAISVDTANAAVITKMIRVMMLAPFLIVLSAFLQRSASTEHGSKSPIVIPWFAVMFIVVAGFNSLHLLPSSWVAALQFIDTLFLAMAMTALGLTTHISAIRQAGTKPLMLAALLFIWLILGGFMINETVHSLLG